MIFLTLHHGPFNVNNMSRIRAIYVLLTYKDKNSLQSPDNRKRTIHKKRFPLTFRYYSKFPLMPLSNLYLQKENVLVSYARCSCHRWPIFLQKRNTILCTVAKQCPFLTTRQGILKTSFLMKGRLVFLMKDW